MIAQLIPFSLFGGICGLAWAFALGLSLRNGIITGLIAGAVIGFILYFMGKAARAGGNVTKREARFVSGSIGGTLIGLTLLCAVIAWIVRLIFLGQISNCTTTE